MQVDSEAQIDDLKKVIERLNMELKECMEQKERAFKERTELKATVKDLKYFVGDGQIEQKQQMDNMANMVGVSALKKSAIPKQIIQKMNFIRKRKSSNDE